MKHSREGSELDVSTFELDLLDIAIDIVVKRFPKLCGKVAQLARRFRQLNYAQEWFAMYLRNRTRKSRSPTVVKCIRLAYAALKHVESGMLAVAHYHSYVNRYVLFKELGQSYFLRDGNFNFQHKWQPFWKPIFLLLSMSNDEFLKQKSKFFDQDILRQARLHGVAESELIQFRDLLSNEEARRLFNVNAGIYFGFSVDFFASFTLESDISQFTWNEFSKRGIRNLIQWCNRFPSVTMFAACSPMVAKKAFKMRNFELCKKLFASGRLESVILLLSHYENEFNLAQLQEVIPYHLFDDVFTVSTYWPTEIKLIILGQEYFEHFSGLDCWICTHANKLFHQLLCWFNGGPRFVCGKIGQCRIFIERLQQFSTNIHMEPDQLESWKFICLVKDCDTKESLNRAFQESSIF